MKLKSNMKVEAGMKVKIQHVLTTFGSALDFHYRAIISATLGLWYFIFNFTNIHLMQNNLPCVNLNFIKTLASILMSTTYSS